MADDIKFLLWLLLLSSASLCFGSDLDIQCLRAVQDSLIDPNGILKSSWNFSKGYICAFAGVYCWDSGDENRVLSLSLENMGLQGSFPKGLQICTSITRLSLSGNNLSGTIPADIDRQVPYLTLLDLSSNSFSGEIPKSIANMTYLNTLDLRHNQLSGQIPEQFNTLGRLSSFNVAVNQLSGPIPAALEKFGPSNFAGNRGLCGAPLPHNCPRRRSRLIRIRLHSVNYESSIGGAVGFVAGFVVALYFPRCFVFSQRLHPYVFRI